MPKLIKNGAVIDDNWTILAKDSDLTVGQSNVFVSKQTWLDKSDTLAGKEDVAVWLDSDEGPEELAPYLDQLSAVAINFPKFSDGRGYSYARLLRERFGFKGEIRAIGDVLHDQLFFLQRCGFDAFAVREDKDVEAALPGLVDFSENYQAACDNDIPLFRRRG